MPFFNIGDTAHVRCDLSLDGVYYVVISNYRGEKYRISELSGEPIDFNWTDEMFQEYIERNESCEVGSDDDLADFIGL